MKPFDGAITHRRVLDPSEYAAELGADIDCLNGAVTHMMKTEITKQTVVFVLERTLTRQVPMPVTGPVEVVVENFAPQAVKLNKLCEDKVPIQAPVQQMIQQAPYMGGNCNEGPFVRGPQQQQGLPYGYL